MTVLSEETVVDGLLVQPSDSALGCATPPVRTRTPGRRKQRMMRDDGDVYLKADPNSATLTRPEYVPPRAFARRNRYVRRSYATSL